MFSGLHLKADARRSREKNRSHPAMDPLVADQAQMRGIVVAMTGDGAQAGRVRRAKAGMEHDGTTVPSFNKPAMMRLVTAAICLPLMIRPRVVPSHKT
jgi:hypothetical protein